MSDQSPKSAGTEVAQRRATTSSKLWFFWMVGLWVVGWTIVSIPRPKKEKGDR